LLGPAALAAFSALMNKGVIHWNLRQIVSHQVQKRKDPYIAVHGSHCKRFSHNSWLVKLEAKPKMNDLYMSVITRQ
jgi:hypothetical protein